MSALLLEEAMDPSKLFSEHTYPTALSIVLLLAIGGGLKLFFDRFFKKWDLYHDKLGAVDQHMVANTASSTALKESVDRLNTTITDQRITSMQAKVDGLASGIDKAVAEMREHRDQAHRDQAHRSVVVPGHAQVMQQQVMAPAMNVTPVPQPPTSQRGTMPTWSGQPSQIG